MLQNKYFSTLHAIISGQLEGEWIKQEIPDRRRACYICFGSVEADANIFREPLKNGYREYAFHGKCKTMPLQ